MVKKNTPFAGDFFEEEFSVALEKNFGTQDEEMFSSFCEDPYNFSLGFKDKEGKPSQIPSLIKEGDKIVFYYENENFVVPKNLNFSIIDVVGKWPVFYTKVVGVSFGVRPTNINRLFLKSQNGTELIAKIGLCNEYDPYGHIVNLQYCKNKKIQTLEVGFLPRQLSRILVVLEKYHKINYNVKLTKITEGFSKGPSIVPGSIGLTLSPDIERVPQYNKGPIVGTLQFSGLSVENIREKLKNK